MSKLSKIKDELADKHADNYFQLDDDLPEEEMNTRNGIVHDFKRGFDAACAEWEKIVAPLVIALKELESHYTALHPAHYRFPDVIIREALENYRKCLND